MKILNGKKRAFFIGVGGIGMSALARYLLNKGIEIYGYDRTETALTKKLVSEGMKVHYQDDVKHIPDNIDIVVYTPAIPDDHVQLNWFKDQGYQLHKRSELLKEILLESKVIGVAGTHGKTSTSSVISHLLKDSKVPATCFVGGIMVNYDTNFIYGDSKWVVIEADEYDRSFLRLYPDVAVIQALDPDHLDIYGTPDEMVKTYKQFTLQIKKGGLLIVPDHVMNQIDEEWLEELMSRDIEVVAYGVFDEVSSGTTDVIVKSLTANQLHTTVSLQSDQKDVELEVPFAGRHNALNSVGASIVANKLGLDWPEIKNKLSTFKGIWRRFEVIYQSNDQIFIDDYAHHPMEIRAMVTSLRKAFPSKKLTVVFQPHLYTRTRDFVDGFAEELSKCDEVILLPIYPARELPIEGVTSSMIMDKMTLKGTEIIQKQDLIKTLKGRNLEVLATLGAGDIDKLVEGIRVEVFY